MEKTKNKSEKNHVEPDMAKSDPVYLTLQKCALCIKHCELFDLLWVKDVQK